MNHSRTVVSHLMQLDAAPNEVFPLLCPVREYEWIEGWACEMIYSATGKAEAGAVFRTAFAADGPPDTWVISHYAPPRAIEFVRGAEPLALDANVDRPQPGGRCAGRRRRCRGLCAKDQRAGRQAGAFSRHRQGAPR